MKFTKKGDVQYISHLDLMRVLMRAMRRANIPVAMTQGYNPHPKLSLSHALAVGINSQAEYADLDLYRPIKLDELILQLNQTLPEGIKILQAGFVATNCQSLTSLINRLVYKIQLKECISKSKIEEFLAKEEILSFREGKELNIRQFIDQITAANEPNELLVCFKVDNGKTVKFPEFLQALLGEEKQVENISRVDQFYKDDSGNSHSPL
ncbi:MAG: TIGR03936 family radical SAM-associated protein [bacterium]